MSRYDRYADDSLRLLKLARDIARGRRDDNCRPAELALALLAGNPDYFQTVLEQNALQVDRDRVARESGAPAPAEEPGAKLPLSPEFRSILDRAEQLAGTGPVEVHHLVKAGWPVLVPELKAFLRTGDGAAPDIANLQLPDPESGPASDAAEPEAAGAPAKPGKPGDAAKFLAGLGRELTAEKGTHPIVGRDAEIEELCTVLLKLFKPNPLLVGEAGVGKTAIVEGLARRISEGSVPDALRGKRIYEIRMNDLVAGTKFRGEFEERMKKVIAAAETDPAVILFVDEIHTVVGAGSGDGSPGDAANVFKPALARGKLHCIGATTQREYAKWIEPDAALARRFHPIRIDEPDESEVRQILTAALPSLEKHHGVQVPPELLNEAIRQCRDRIINRQFPDKGFDVLDRACAAAAMAGHKQLTADNIANAVGAIIGIASGSAPADGPGGYLARLEELLGREIKGQPEAIAAVARTVRLCKQRLDLRPERPDGVFLFAGPTGVGKTALAEALAGIITGRADGLARIDMNEFSEEYTVSRLLGSPPGYVGHGEEPQLIRAIRNLPNGVLLLDEFEKAHPEVHQVFLRAFDEGRVTDSRGETYALAHLTIIATVNIVPEKTRGTVGFGGAAAAAPGDALHQALRRHFPPEMINRFDEIVLFRPLGEPELLAILRERVLRDANAGLRRERNLELALAPALEQELIAQAEPDKYGARQLLRLFQTRVLVPLAAELAAARPAAGAPARLRVEPAPGGAVRFHRD